MSPENFRTVLAQSLGRVTNWYAQVPDSFLPRNRDISQSVLSEAFSNDKGCYYIGYCIFFGGEDRQTCTRTNQRRRIINSRSEVQPRSLTINWYACSDHRERSFIQFRII